MFTREVHPPCKRQPFAAPALTVLTLLGAAAWADDPEAAALRLADETHARIEEARNWRAFAEIGVGQTALRDGGTRTPRRVSVDFRYDGALSSGGRAVFADRLDLLWPGPQRGKQHVNTIKEAYLGWRLGPQTLFDAGRINARHGVALGYNPTDYFRGGALRAVVSIGLASLKAS